MNTTTKTCKWNLEDEYSNTWKSECNGIEWFFPEGSPLENDMKYCPFCSNKLILN